MKRLFPALLLAATASLTACDYNRTPGKDPETQNFSDAPPATSNVTDRDSITGKQRVEPPIGTGSAASQNNSDSTAITDGSNDPNSPVSSMPQQSPEQRSTAR